MPDIEANELDVTLPDTHPSPEYGKELDALPDRYGFVLETPLAIEVLLRVIVCSLVPVPEQSTPTQQGPELDAVPTDVCVTDTDAVQ